MRARAQSWWNFFSMWLALRFRRVPSTGRDDEVVGLGLAPVRGLPPGELPTCQDGRELLSDRDAPRPLRLSTWLVSRNLAITLIILASGRRARWTVRVGLWAGPSRKNRRPGGCGGRISTTMLASPSAGAAR